RADRRRGRGQIRVRTGQNRGHQGKGADAGPRSARPPGRFASRRRPARDRIVVTTKINRTTALAVVAVLCLGAAACTGGAPTTTRSDATRPNGTIVVGVSGAFTENQLVAEMYADVLEHAGYRVERQFDLRSREVSQDALESGQIDVKPEYLSSLLLYLDPNGSHSNDPSTVAAQVAARLAPSGISVLTPSPAQDQ